MLRKRQQTMRPPYSNSVVSGSIALGRQLVEVLAPHVLPGTPLAQVVECIAGLLREFDAGDAFDGSGKGRELVDAVRALWAYRIEFPESTRPFPMFEPVLQALQCTDRNALSAARLLRFDHESTVTAEHPWRPAALSGSHYLDLALAPLIEAALREAVRLATRDASQWICFAMGAGLDDGFELAAIRRLASGAVPGAEAQTSEMDSIRTREKLEAISLLQHFLMNGWRDRQC